MNAHKHYLKQPILFEHGISLLLFGIIFTIATSVSAQINVSQGSSPEAILEQLFGHGVNISNIEMKGDPRAFGTFSADDPEFGLEEGLMLSTGNSGQATHPVADTISTDNFGLNSNLLRQLVLPFQTHDAAILEFDLIPSCDSISIRYIFASEEYVEWVDSVFNDVFGFFISGPGIEGDIGFNGSKNIALIPGAKIPVTINNVNHLRNSELFVFNEQHNHAISSGFAYDGYTVPLEAKVAVTPCESYHIIIAIADVGDFFFDSAVFIESEGIRCTQPSLEVEAFSASTNFSNRTVESCFNGEFVFTLSEPAPENLFYPIEINGTATPGEDFVQLPPFVAISEGDQRISIPVIILEDDITEGLEEITISFIDSSKCGDVLHTGTATLFIQDGLSLSKLPDMALCSGDSVNIPLTKVDGQSYKWLTTEGLSNPSIPSPILTLTNTSNQSQTTPYILQTRLENEQCSFTDTMNVSVLPKPSLSVVGDQVCVGSPAVLIAEPNMSPDSVEILWFESPVSQTVISEGIVLETEPLKESTIFGVSAVTQVGCESQRIEVEAKVNTTTDPIIFVNNDTLEIPSASVRPAISGIHFQQIRSLTWDFGDGATSNIMVPTHTYQQEGEYNIRAKLTTSDGCSFNLSTDIKVIKPVRLNFPTAFSPNEDGINDVFHIHHKLIQEFSLYIYNRWGNLIFSTTDPDFQWRGEDRSGTPQEEGVYTFIVSAVDIDGLYLEQGGSITLIR